ncbi:MAG: alanine dehydrogenase [Kiritimatiellaeota bacterium]|nr:alanine dehydrogenase [Kiritimatiellota bacterium]
MIVGTVREVKRHEYRVGLTPDCVRAYVAHTHRVLVEKGAGAGAGFLDREYAEAGAELVDAAAEVFARSEMIVKVKEPQPGELHLLRSGQVLFTYLHLAAEPELSRALIRIGVDAVAYETIETDNGHLPCLKPMSQVAGRLAVQEGAKYLEKRFGGRGILLGGVPGVMRGRVVILGGGVVGLNACKVAVGLGAEVTVLDIDAERLAYFEDVFAGRVTTLYSTRANIETALRECDLLIGAVLRHGARAPHLVVRGDLKRMKPGAVIVDVAIDQGGCIETSRPTTHDDPIFVLDGIVHYCVANMPGAVARTATRALTSSTLRYGLLLADRGTQEACRESKALCRGVNIYRGHCVYENVASAVGVEYVSLASLLGCGA